MRNPQRRLVDRACSRDPAILHDAHQLDSAIREDLVRLRYQPQIEVQTGQVRSVEALARWDGGPNDAALFDRAHRLGMAERLSRAMQRKAIREAAAWTGPLAKVGIAVNILPCELARDNYVDWLLDEMRIARLAPARLTIEIVETALVVDGPALRERLDGLRARGVGIAVDDFGTGYANLAYLTALPLNQMKIDRGLVTQIVGGERERIVLKALLDLGHALGMETVVEGVEQFGQLALLSQWNCDLYQGFLGAGALDCDELERFVRAADLARVA